MNPPWITLWNEINSSVGNDPSVAVAPLDESVSPYVARIRAQGRAKAIGIASTVKPRHEFGNVTVAVEVIDGQGMSAAPVVPGSANELADLVRSGFNSNGWLCDVVVKDIFGRHKVFAVFRKGVIQFFNDDLSDLYGNYNQVAAAVFGDVLGEAPGGFDFLCSTDGR